MSQTVDYRIVEMRFDNKQFETGAKQSMSTLDKLKAALKLPETGKALEGLDKATKNIKLDGIASGIEALERRFSTLGIVGMRVIENITDGLMNKLHGAVSFVTDAIVSGGIKRAMNIENAHFQLQALLKDETKVQAVMADAMESVDGTAYAYDEAAKAASQFAASGIQAGDEMLGALKGITGVAAMTNSSFEDVSRIFTTVAGNGRLMGDQLLQLSSRGLNAASTLADYFKEVRGQAGMTEADVREMVSKGKISFKDFSDAMTWAFGDSAKRANETFTGAMSNMKSALARIGAGFISPLVEQNGELVQLFNALRIKINDVKSALVFDEQRSAVSGLAEATGMTKDQLDGMFKTIKANGKVSISDLDTLTKKGANATDALTKYVNGVTDGSIRASYAISSALTDLTNGTKVSTADIRRFVEEGKIDLSTFTSAMETEFGNEKTLSKQFTDFFLDHVHMIVEAINEADLTKPMEIFYYWVEIVKNLVTGLLSVLDPVGDAFSEVFFSFDADTVISFSDAIERLTSKMRLSERGSENLHDAMKGLFSVVKLVVDIFFTLLKAVVPINKPVVEMSGGFLGLAGAMGRALTSFTLMIRSCTLLKRAFGVLSSGFSIGMDGLSKLIKIGKDFISTLSGMEGTTKLINAVINAFEKLGTKATPYIEDFINEAENFFKSLFNIEDINIDDVLNNISNAFSDLAWEIDHFSFDSVEEAVDALKNKLQGLIDLGMSNEGIATFVTNFKKFGEELKEAFTLDNLLDRIERVMDVFGKFFKWITDVVGPTFKDLNAGSVVAAGGGIGIIYAMIKAAKSFESISKSVANITGLFGSLKGTLVAYQKDLKASALIKIAGAIAILSGALVLLSFADTERLFAASMALSLISGILLLGITKFLEAVNKGKELNSAVTTFSKGLSKSMKNLSKAVKIKAVGSAVKDFAISVAIMAVSIVGLGLMWRKDSEAFESALKTIAGVGLALVAITGLMVIASKIGSAKGMVAIGGSIFTVVASLALIILAINKLMKMDLPDDYDTKLKILGGIIAGLAGLALALGLTAKIAGQNQLPKMASTIKSLAILMVATVLSLKVLFDMNLPTDYDAKLKILGGIFVGLGALLLTMAAAAKIAGGNGFKAAGTILAMSVFLVTVVGSLFILTLIPSDKMLKGAIALGGVLVALGVALAGVSKIADANAYKNVIAMAVTVGVIVASLAVLSMIPWENLKRSAIVLGAILGILAADFVAISKITNDSAWITAAAMVAAVLGISVSLYALAQQPWTSLLAGAVGLSLVLVAMSGAFFIISKANPNLVAMAAFGEAVAAVLLISHALYKISEQPYESILAAGNSLTKVLLAMTVAMGVAALIGAVAGAAIVGIGILDLFIANILLVLAGLGKLAQNENIVALMNGGMDMLIKLGDTIGEFVGAMIKGALTQIASGLPRIGTDLSDFMINLRPFAIGSKLFGDDVLKGVGILAACIIALTVGEFISGIASLFGLSLIAVAVELSAFMVALRPFIAQSKSLDEESMRACGYLAEMIIKLTAAELISGISSFLGFGGGLSDFADELKAFGPSIAEFAETVKDVNPEAVKGAASAAEIMATTASKLQGHGGIIQDIVGDKSLKTFADELKAFGPSIAEFAETVKDVNPEAVKGAASAAEIMATVAEKLPNQGGLASKIFGEKSLSTFGDELTSFGRSIVPFTILVRNVNPSSVTGVQAITEIMTTLATNLPNSETLWSKIFGGGQVTLSEFGKELVKFGQSMSDFSASVAGVNVDLISKAVAGFKELVDLSSTVQNTSATSLVNFSNQLGQIGVDSVNKFIQAFSDAGPRVSTAISALYSAVTFSLTAGGATIQASAIMIGNNLCIGIQTGIAQKQSAVVASEMALVTTMTTTLKNSLQIGTFNTLGQNVVQGLITGINSKKPLTLSTIKNLCTAIINQFRVSLPTPTFNSIGQSVVQALINGMMSKKDSATSAAIQICNAIIQAFKNNLSQSAFKDIGANAALGLKYGIESKINEISNAAVRAAREAVESAKRELDIHSPSRVAFKLGNFFSLGLAGGILNSLKAIGAAGTMAADEAVEPVKKAVDVIGNIVDSGFFDTDPVIRPVVDLSSVKSGFDEINSMMNRTFSLSSAYNNVMSASSTFKKAKKANSNDEDIQTGSGANIKYEFNQNNYSPKALSRSEIYRDTQNQFAAFRRAVNPT